MTDREALLEERRRARRFFNWMSSLFPIIERHLFPRYRDVLSRIAFAPGLSVLDLVTGTGIQVGAFAERGHAVTGLDFADKLLDRARRRFPKVNLRKLDAGKLGQIGTGAYCLVAIGYFLHGLSPDFRRFMLGEWARIARAHVLIFDDGRDGGWLIRFIAWIEGPSHLVFIVEDGAKSLNTAGLRVDCEERASDFGSCWLCACSPGWVAGSGDVDQGPERASGDPPSQRLQ
jgi:SAM-dependent methyltransferase